MCRRAPAFSLVEVLMAVTVLSVISVGVYRVMRSQAVATSEQAGVSQTLRDSLRAKVLLQNDLLRAGFDPRHVDEGRAAVTPLSAAANDGMTLQADLDMSGRVGDSAAGAEAEEVTYLYDADTRRVTRNGAPFLLDVTGFSIAYVDSGGVADDTVPGPRIASLGDVRRVGLRWEQRVGRGRPQITEFSVTFRNSSEER